jgi:non-specific serine/threonine protein kinase
MIGRTFSHYRILEHIGGGGMGVVYKAEDIRLNRPVALKFLPPEFSRDPEAKKRFLLEARTLSTLQHNNICTLHEIDEADDGQMFMVMDLYEGATLKERIGRGPLSVDEAGGIAVQIAQGLVRAHERGIYHRDIKPANILLTSDGTVKILDFGLSKFTGETMFTREGTTLGTTSYMSPEQTRGEEIDARTDIWALGVILYQMVSGRLPFGSEHEQAVIYNIQHTDPPSLASLREDLPDAMCRIIGKALSKNPAGRYQTTGAMLSELLSVQNLRPVRPGALPSGPTASLRKKILIGAGSVLVILAAAAWYILFGKESPAPPGAQGTPQSLKRLAVLPFANLRSNPETDFLGFAMADQIIGNLSYVKTLLVRPSVAIRQYQNQTIDAVTAGKVLNVDYILTGNYLKESDVVRLSVELVDVHSNGIIWRDAIQEAYVDAFRLEDIVAKKVVDGLRVQFSPEEIRHMQADVPRNSLAYELYLRAVSSPALPEGERRAVALLRESIDLDSTYAPAFSELGYRLQQMANYVLGEQKQSAAAELAYRKAIALNPELLTAVTGLSSIYTDLGRTEEAFDLAQRALAINPNSPRGHFFLGYVCRYAGLQDEARDEMEKAVALDPNNPRFRSIGLTYLYRGEFEKAPAGFDLDPGGWYNLSWRAYAYARLGERDRAVAACDSALLLAQGSVVRFSAGVLRAYLLGRTAEGRSLVHEWEKISTIDGEQWYTLAVMAAALKDTAACVRSLRKAIDGGFFNYPTMRADAMFDPIRGDPTFEQLLAYAQAKHEAFKLRHSLKSQTG